MRDIFSYLLKPVGEWAGNLARNLLSDVTGADPNSIGHGLSDTILGTHYGQSEMMNEQAAINSRLAQEERSWQERMLAEDRAYNSPANQMAMMREAGLNPSLAFGQLSDMSGTAPNAGAASVGLGSAQHGTLGGLNPLTVAQIENINADTEKKREETHEKQISNEVVEMNANAFKSAYQEGLVHSALKAGLSKDIDDAGISRYTLMEDSWNFAILTGCSLAESFRTGGLDTFGWEDTTGRPVVFDYSEDAFKRANRLYIGSEESQIKVNEAAKKAAELQIQADKKGFDIYKALNEAADRGEIWAKIVRIGLFIAEQRFNMPSFNLSISNNRKSSSKK